MGVSEKMRFLILLLYIKYSYADIDYDKLSAIIQQKIQENNDFIVSKIEAVENKINETNNSMDDRFMMFFENDDDEVFNKKSVDNRLNEIELTLLELEVDSKSDYADPMIPIDSNLTDLSNLTNSFTEDLNALRDTIDGKITTMKGEIMLQVQEKIDQALSEIDVHTDRSDQIDSIKSNIQVEIMLLKSELEDQIKNQTSNIAMDIEKIIDKASNREARLQSVENRMEGEKEEFEEIKNALLEQKNIFEKFEEDEVKVLSSIQSHSEKFRLVVGDLENIKPMVADLQQFVHNQEVQNQHVANDIAKIQKAEQSFESKLEEALQRWQGSFTEKMKQIETKCDESCAKDAKSDKSSPSATIDIAKLDTCRLICKPGNDGEQKCLIQDCGSSSELNGPCESNSHCAAGLECNVHSKTCVKRPMNYLSIGGKSVLKNDQSKLTRWDVIIYDMEVPGKPFEPKYISSKSRRITGMPNSGFQR